MQRDRSDPPFLAHARDHSRDAAAESQNGCDSGGKLLGLVVDLWPIAGEAALEDEVVGQGDALVDGEPVADEVHEILEDGLEVRVARDGDGDVYARAQEGPDEPGHALGPAAQDLEGQSDRVDVRAVVGNNGECEDDDTELAEPAQSGE